MGFMDKVKAKRAADAAANGVGAEVSAAAALYAPAAPVEAPVVAEVVAEATAAPVKSAAQLFKEKLKNKPVVVATADAAEVPAEAVTAAAEAVVAPANAILSPDAAPRATSEERSAELRGEAQAKLDKKTAKKKTTKKKKHTRTLTIYFGCRPIKGEHQAFAMAEDWCHDLMSALNAELEEKTTKGYWGQDFSGQKDSLGQAVQARVEAGDVPEVLVCMSGGLVREITNMLIPFASDAVER